MTALLVPLSEEHLERLKKLADQEGISPEDWARANLEQCLSKRREDFLKAARYVLDKNEELYRRLA